MDHAEQVSKSPVGGAVRRRAALAAVLWAALLAVEAAGQPAGLFTPVGTMPDSAALRVSPTPPDPLTLRRRLVTIDFAQLASSDVAVAARAAGVSAEAPRSVGPAYGELLRLNLFDDTVFTGVVERIEPTFSGGYAVSGRLVGVEWGTLTLVVNGDVVAGTIRTLETTYRIRPAGNGLHTVSEVESVAAAASGRAGSRRTGRPAAAGAAMILDGAGTAPARADASARRTELDAVQTGQAQRVAWGSTRPLPGPRCVTR